MVQNLQSLFASAALAVFCVSAGPALASAEPDPATDPAPAATDAPSTEAAGPAAPTDDEWLKQFAPDPESEASKRYAEQQKRRLATERELKLIRARHFKGIRGTELRQAGIAKLKEFTDPAVFPALLEIFGTEGVDVQNALLDHWADMNLDEADATIAWAAVFGKDKAFRLAAARRLVKKAESADWNIPNVVKSVVAIGLRRESNTQLVAAAELANMLQIFEAIPALISAQVSGTATGSQRAQDGGDAALAYILVGRQVAFVSDLNPVVGDNAVAFDPTLSVATEGVVLRVIDAFVVTYHVEVNRSLIGLANKGWDGRDTAPLGWNTRAWRQWYANEFVPYRRGIAIKP